MRAVLRPCPMPTYRALHRVRRADIRDKMEQIHCGSHVLIWVSPTKSAAQHSNHLLSMLPVSQDPCLGPMSRKEDVQALPTTLVSPGKTFLACPGQPSPAAYGIHAINRRDAKGLRLGPAQAAAQGT